MYKNNFLQLTAHLLGIKDTVYSLCLHNITPNKYRVTPTNKTLKKNAHRLHASVYLLQIHRYVHLTMQTRVIG